MKWLVIHSESRSSCVNKSLYACFLLCPLVFFFAFPLPARPMSDFSHDGLFVLIFLILSQGCCCSPFPVYGSPPSPPLPPLPPHTQGHAPLTLAHSFPLDLERDTGRLAPPSPPQECWKPVHLLWIWLLFEILPYGERRRPGFLHFLTLLFKHREMDFSHLISTLIKIWQRTGKPYWHPLPGELIVLFFADGHVMNFWWCVLVMA